MTLTRTLAAPVVPAAARRDTTIDAVRAACLIIVVVLHALMVGVEVAPGGGLQTSVALSGESWFVPITWLLQIMPLFFIAGGFVSLMQWRRRRAAGERAVQYIAGRIRRLAVPAGVMVVVVGGVLLLAKALGADPALIDEASLRIGQPLWFLAVYLGVTALVPVMAWLHERRPMATILALAGGVLLVDLVSAHTSLPIGYLNLLLVWPLMQQLGFVMLDGIHVGWSRRKLLTGMFTALSLLFVLIAFGWSADMLENLNPPTTAIVLLGAVQFFGLLLLRPWLDEMTHRPAIARLAEKASTYAMEIYLWHMSVALCLVTIMWAVHLPLPEPHSGAWWATRLPWIVAIFACVIPLTMLAARVERRVLSTVTSVVSGLRGTWLDRRTAAVGSVLLSIGGTTTALLAGLADPLPFVTAVLLLAGGAGLAVCVLNGKVRQPSTMRAVA